MIAAYSNLDSVYLSDAVNRQHALNQGRVAWYLTLPNLDGGNQFYDIMGLHHGTLLGMTNTSGWRGSTRHGGSRHLLFDGSDDYVSLGDPAGMTITTGNCTLAAWVLPAATSVSTALIVGRGNLTTVTRLLSISLPNSGKARIELYDNTNNPFLDSGVSIVGTGWRRVCGVRRSGTLLLYLDSVLQGTVTDTSGNIGGGTGSLWTIGRRMDSSYFNGSIDDATVWNRALSAAEVQADYDLGRTGYPNVLNRWEPQFYSFGESIKISPYWYAKRVHQ